MPPPTSPLALTRTALAVTVGLLLPGALAGQQTTRVPVPSLEQPRAAAAPSRASHLPDAPHAGLAPGRSLAPAADLDPGTPGETGRFGAEALPGETSHGTSTVLDAVFSVASPVKPVAEDARRSLGSLGDVLPRGLCRDLLELRARIRRYRTVLFGQRGILRWGEVEGGEGHGRVRLNLQADPHPGLRVTLVTR